jgi:hypothetical protein
VNVPIVRELVYVLAVNLQILSSYRVTGSAVRTAGLWRRYPTRPERVEEAILALGGVRCEGWGWSRVFFFEVIPLSRLVLRTSRRVPCLLVCWCSGLQGTRCGGLTSMRHRKCLRYRRATRARRDGGRSTCTRPSTMSTLAPAPFVELTYIDNGVCGTREQQRLVLRQTEAQHAAFVRADDSPALVRVEAVDLPCLAKTPTSRLHVHSTHQNLSALGAREDVLRRDD